MKKSETKRSARLIKDLETLLFNLRNKDKGYTYKRLYRLFFNSKYYNHIDENTIKTLRDESYQAGKEVRPLLVEVLRSIFKIEPENAHKAIAMAAKQFKKTESVALIDLSPIITSFQPRNIERIIRARVDDERFIRLINKYLKAGYPKLSKEESYSKTFSGDPLSQTLLEIILSPIDDFLEDKNWVRYRNEGLLEVKGNSLKDLEDFINKNYKCSLKVTIKKRGQQLRFLSYELRLLHGNSTRLYIPQNIIKKFIVSKGLVRNIDEKPWHSVHRGYLLNLSDKEIFDIYNLELKNFYEYYRLASNVSRKFGQLKHIMETSCLKTLARKHRTGMNQIKQKYQLQDSWGINIPFYKGFRRKPPRKSNCDKISKRERFVRRNS